MVILLKRWKSIRPGATVHRNRDDNIFVVDSTVGYDGIRSRNSDRPRPASIVAGKVFPARHSGRNVVVLRPAVRPRTASPVRGHDDSACPADCRDGRKGAPAHGGRSLADGPAPEQTAAGYRPAHPLWRHTPPGSVSPGSTGSAARPAAATTCPILRQAGRC